MLRFVNKLGYAVAGITGVGTVVYVSKSWSQKPPLSTNLRLDNKKVIITGGTNGIGSAVAWNLAVKHGADVTIATRDLKACEEMKQNAIKEYETIRDKGWKESFNRPDLKSEREGKSQKNFNLTDPRDLITCKLCDLKSFKSVRDFADSVEQVDILVNNAAVLKPKHNASTAVATKVESNKEGVTGSSKNTLQVISKTENGNEETFQTNYLSHFYLSNLLREKFSPGGTIINVTCKAQLEGKLKITDINRVQDTDSDYNKRSNEMYKQSKLCNVLFTKEAAKRWPEITSIAVDPGQTADSKLGKRMATDAGIVKHFGYYVNPATWFLKSGMFSGETGQCAQAVISHLFNPIKTGHLYDRYEEVLDLLTVEKFEVTATGGFDKAFGNKQVSDAYSSKNSSILWKYSCILTDLDNKS